MSFDTGSKSDLHQQNSQQNVNVDFVIDENFFGIFDNAFTKEYCDSVISYFKKLDKAGYTYFRSESKLEHHKNKFVVEDKLVSFENQSFYVQDELNFNDRIFPQVFWNVCYPLYVEKYVILKAYDKHAINNINLQRTLPGQGYHAWHCESNGRVNCNRILAFNVYLNDVEEGGETEFLYLHKRIQAKAGRLVIWPAGFTHTHRGNPPLSGEKYILTGWVEF